MFGWLRKRQSPLIGVWLLVQAGDKSPEIMNILSMRLVISGDGAFWWESHMCGPWAGMTLSGSGQWVADGEWMTFSGQEMASTSVIRVEGARLMLDPDLVLVSEDTTPVVGIYQREYGAKADRGDDV